METSEAFHAPYYLAQNEVTDEELAEMFPVRPGIFRSLKDLLVVLGFFMAIGVLIWRIL